MATSVGMRCRGNRFLTLRESERFCFNSHNACACPASVSASVSSRRSFRTMRISMSAAKPGSDVIAKKAKDSKDEAVLYGKMDEWMRDSVAEIVKNLREAPLLVHVYCSKDGETKATLKTEKAVEEQSWPMMVERWKRRETPLPEGMIFVEQLANDEQGSDEQAEEVTRAWGIVVQGKWADCGPICYLLKTSRAGNGPGMGGVCCTHFCLMRVSSFRETARSQLKNCWLSQAHLN